MAINAPTATQSNSPLLYKGAFSTRKNTRNKSRYNYMHDKLHHIKFLGLATYDGSVDSDFMMASYIRLNMGGIDGEETYSLAQSKYKESLVGEGLRGRTRFEGMKDSLLMNISSINIAEKLSKLSEEIEKELDFARLFNSIDIIKEEILKRLDEIKESVLETEGLYERTGPKIIKGIIEGVEELEKRVKDVDSGDSHTFVTVERINIKDLDILEEHVLEKVFQKATMYSKPSFVKVPRPVELDSQYALVEANIVKDICKAAILNYVDSIKGIKGSEVDWDEIMDIKEIELASIILAKEVADKITYGDILYFDSKLLDKAMKESIVTKTILSLLESKACEIAIDAFSNKGIILEPKVGAVIHYKLMKDDRLYQGKIQKEVSKYLKALGVRSGYLKDIQSEVAEIVLNKAALDTDYMKFTKVLDGNGDLIDGLANTLIEEFEKLLFHEFSKNFVGDRPETNEARRFIFEGKLSDLELANDKGKDTTVLEIFLDAFRKYEAKHEDENILFNRINGFASTNGDIALSKIIDNSDIKALEPYSVTTVEYTVNDSMLHSKVIKDFSKESLKQSLTTIEEFETDSDLPMVMARNNRLIDIGMYTNIVSYTPITELENEELFDMTREAVSKTLEVIMANKLGNEALVDNQISSSIETLKIDSIENIIAHRNVWKAVQDVFSGLGTGKTIIPFTELDTLVSRLIKLAEEIKAKEIIADRPKVVAITNSILDAITDISVANVESDVISLRLSKILEIATSISVDGLTSFTTGEEYNYLLSEDIRRIKDSDLMLTYLTEEILKDFKEQSIISSGKLNHYMLMDDIKELTKRSSEGLVLQRKLYGRTLRLAEGFNELYRLTEKVIQSNSTIDLNADLGKHTYKRQKNSRIDTQVFTTVKEGLDMLVQHIKTMSREYKGLCYIVEDISIFKNDNIFDSDNLIELTKISGDIDVLDAEDFKRLITVKGKIDKLLDEIGLGGNKIQKALLDEVEDAESQKADLTTLLENIKDSVGNVIDNFAVIQELTNGDGVVTSKISQILQDILQRQNKSSYMSYLDKSFDLGSGKTYMDFNVLDLGGVNPMMKVTDSKTLEELHGKLESEVIQYSNITLDNYVIGNKLAGNGGQQNEQILYGSIKENKESKLNLKLRRLDKLNIQVNTTKSHDTLGNRIDEIHRSLINDGEAFSRTEKTVDSLEPLNNYEARRLEKITESNALNGFNTLQTNVYRDSIVSDGAGGSVSVMEHQDFIESGIDFFNKNLKPNINNISNNLISINRVLPLKAVIEDISVILSKVFKFLPESDNVNLVTSNISEIEQGMVVHNWLYQYDKIYRDMIIETLSSMTSSQKSKLKGAVDLIEFHESFLDTLQGYYDNYEELAIELIKEVKVDQDEKLASDYLTKGIIEEIHSALGNIETKVEQIADMKGTRVRIDNPAKFDFEHQLVDGESKELDGVLEDINGSFIRKMEEFNEESDVIFIPTNYRKTLLTESLEYNPVKDTREIEMLLEEERAINNGKDILIIEDEPKAEDVKINNTKEAVKHFDSIDVKKNPKDQTRVDLLNPNGKQKDTEVTLGSSPSTELHGQLTSDIEYDYPGEEPELWGELVTGSEELINSYVQEEYLAEITNPVTPLKPTIESQLFGELTSVDMPLKPDNILELFGEYSDSHKPLSPTIQSEIFAERISLDTRKGVVTKVEAIGDREVKSNTKIDGQEEEKGEEVTNRSVYDKENEHEIAVFSCTSPKLKLRKRDDLKPDPKPEEPDWEWSCDEGYVCDDWLIVPLKDFDFEHSDQGFYDPETFQPFYPTGKYDDNGNPYILAPYAVLNEPISNGVDVGGKEPMFINPCNIYSAIKYLIKVYDSYKSKFIASDPVAVISRILNMLFERIQEINSNWSPDSDYTIDEMWRIYRFIRWMAIGVMNRFYRLKLVYIWGDWEETFDDPAFIIKPEIKLNGASVKPVSPYGQVLEGHPMLEEIENSAWVEFEVPEHMVSTTINFEMGHEVPDRPPHLGGEYHWNENFEGGYSGFKIKGDGWVKVNTTDGYGLGVEDPAKPKLYKTDIFTIPSNIALPITFEFDWGLLTNMEGDIKFKLMKDGSEIVSESAPIEDKHVIINNAEPGDYHFEIDVPESEEGLLEPIYFPSEDIQNNWIKGGYHTDWDVVGETIYERENTGAVALVYNQDWLNDMDYEFTGEFMTDYTNYPSDGVVGYQDWIGFIFNVKDENNFYAVGAWPDFSGNNTPIGGFCGVWKVENGAGHPKEGVAPKWKIGNGNFKWDFNDWYKVIIRVQGNNFQIDFNGIKDTITDSSGWGRGSSGLAAYSNPYSTFRNVRYKSKPAFNAYIDNVKIESPGEWLPTPSPSYLIDFYMDSTFSPSIEGFSQHGKQSFSFPILKGRHIAKWVYRKEGASRSVSRDASFIDNIVIRGITIVDAKVEEEFIGCGGHMSARLLIQNLLEYYRKHHQGCHGRRDIWIVE